MFSKVKYWSSSTIHFSRFFTGICLMSGKNNTGTIIVRPSVSRTTIFPRYVLKSMSLMPTFTSFILHIILSSYIFYFSMSIDTVFSPLNAPLPANAGAACPYKTCCPISRPFACKDKQLFSITAQFPTPFLYIKAKRVHMGNVPLCALGRVRPRVSGSPPKPPFQSALGGLLRDSIRSTQPMVALL